jgi:chorismate lyase/3-hydroxybenzoate synthase
VAVRGNQDQNPPSHIEIGRRDATHEARGEGRAGLAGRLPVHLSYVVPDALEALQRAGRETLLAEIHFDASPVLPAAAAHPVASVNMAQLGGARRVEVWTSERPVQYGEAGGIRYSANGDVLFGVVSETIAVDDARFELRVLELYRELFALTEARGYPHLLRAWNYFPAIHGEGAGLENYQRFCRGRALAFNTRYGDFVYRLPSASAVGTQGGSVVVYFMAAREQGVHRENPRQMSAYRYPPQYGPRSPSFARATLKRFGEHEYFFISGTASIVGHESRHEGDFRAQLEETLRNIEALLDSTRRDEGTRFRAPADLSHLKVYLRNPADLALAQEMVQARIGEHVEVLYLQGDVCRRELMVEIEAMVGGR